MSVKANSGESDIMRLVMTEQLVDEKIPAVPWVLQLRLSIVNLTSLELMPVTVSWIHTEGSASWFPWWTACAPYIYTVYTLQHVSTCSEPYMTQELSAQQQEARIKKENDQSHFCFTFNA